MSTTRRLAAILAADVAGYSRLMAADEVGTLAALKAVRREVVDPVIAAHHGRIVKTTGDGMLVEFASAVDAVTCAIAVQERMATRGGAISFRIGINVGDIIIDGDDIFGDGVNVAARVENECEPGRVCISANAFEQVRSKTAFSFDDLGEKALKNIDRPVRIYAARAAAGASAMSSIAEPGKPLPLPDKPSIAVLPFQNMSGDPEQEYFADGMVEDIITALSRFKSLFVIARNSSFTYKGKAVDIKQVGRELGVRYVLEGSVRKAGGRVRITGQLIEAATNKHLWADRFDGAMEDVFELQDKITEQVVGAIAPKLKEAEIERVRLKRPETIDGYDLILRAQALLRKRGAMETNFEGALVLLEQAIRELPDYPVSYALASECHARLYITGLRGLESTRLRALELAHRALDLDKDDPETVYGAAMAIANFESLEDGTQLLERAVTLNPNFADAWYLRGAGLEYLGNHPEAIESCKRALRLMPTGPLRSSAMAIISFSLFFMGQHDDAYAWAERAYQENAEDHLSLRSLTISAAVTNRLDRARSAFQRVQHLFPRSLQRSKALMRECDYNKLVEAYRLVGMQIEAPA